MAHYLFSVHVDDDRPPMSPERQQQAWDDTGDFNDRMREIGALIYANGLHQTGTVIEPSGERSAGLYVTGSRRLGGFWILDFPDEQTALQHAEQAAIACNEPVEVRAFH